MAIQPPLHETVIQLLNDQGRLRVYRWAFAIVPVFAAALTVWVVTLACGGTLQADRPLGLLLIALLATGVVVASRRCLRHLDSTALCQSPMMERIVRALADVESAAAEATTRDAIMETLATNIQIVLDPAGVDTVLYNPRTDSYTLVSAAAGLRDDSQSLPAAHPFAMWLRQQAPGTPLSPAEARVPIEGAPIKTEHLQGDAGIIVPLGKQGWLTLTPSSNQNEFTSTQIDLLHQLCRPAPTGLQRAALVEAQQQRSEELRALYWIAQAIGFSLEADDLMELIYTQLKHVVPTPNFYIALKDQNPDYLTLSFYIENDERLYSDMTWPAGEGLTGVIIKHNMTLRTDDYQAECRRRQVVPHGPQSCYAWMGTALTAGDRSIGTMVASSFNPNFIFSEEDEAFFVTVAAYTAAILERHALYARLEARARQLATLNEIGNLLASSLDLNEVLALVVQHAAELLNSEAGSLLLVDEATGDLVFRTSSGSDADQLIGLRVPAGKGIAGAAFAERRPIISYNTHDDERWYAGVDDELRFVTQSIMAVPLNARGHTIGALEVVNRQDARPFTQEDSELLLSFGAQAAIAIENARLFTTTDQALHARVNELTMLQRIDREINETLDYERVMDLTLAWAMRITGATIGIIAAVQEKQGMRALRFLAHRGYDSVSFTPYLENELWPLSEGLVGQAVELGTTTLVRDPASHARYTQVVPHMAAQLTVPIKRENRVIGVVALESTDIDSFDDEEVALIERMSDHAAIAIENAHLFQQLQIANQAKTEFISFVSHELKQPMTAMKGYTDLLTREICGPLSDQQVQFLQIIKGSVERMDRIVQDLLDVSQIESGGLKLHMSAVKPQEILNEAVRLCEPEFLAKKQALKLDVSETLPTLKADRTRLTQVLLRLMSNANKYTPEGGTIYVQAVPIQSDGHTYVRWSIRDTGIGISPDEMAQLFTKYFRLKHPRVRSVPGMGLGLVISRGIIEMHGGHIDIKSTVGEGSTFSFTVPAASL